MKKTLFFICFFICCISFSQNLEDAIYTATESFISNKNEQSLQKLSAQETLFKSKISTQEEQLAFIFLLCNKGYFLKELNKQKLAISSYEDAWKRYRDHNLSTMSDYDIIEYCLKPLGNLYTKTNDYTNAENTIKQYITLAKQNHDKTQHVAGIINLCALYQSLGKHQSVLALIQESQSISGIEMNQKEKLNRLEASSKIVLNKSTNINLLSNDVIFPNRDNQYNNYQIAYELALKKGHYKSALKYFNGAKIFLKKDSLTTRQLAKWYLEEAQLHYLLHDHENTNNSLQRALKLLLPNDNRNSIPEKTSLYAENTFIDIFDLLARLQNQSENALTYYDLSFYVSNLLTENLTSQEAKIANLTTARKRSEQCIDILYNDYQNNSNSEIFYRALQYAETNKASVLKDAFQKKSLLEQHPEDQLLLKQQQLSQEQERLTDILIKTQLGYEISKNDSLNTQLLDISLQLKTVKNKIEQKYPNVKNILNLTKLQQHLQHDQAVLVEYFYGSNALYQFTVSPKHIGFNKIALTEDTKKALTNFIHLFDNASSINNNINAFTAQAYNTYHLLHLKETASYKNLIMISDGFLNFIPFEALLTEQTETTNFTKMPFLVKEQNMIYNSSIDFYLQPQILTESNRVLGVFPVFKNTSQPLTYSIDEAHAIKAETNATILMNAEATKHHFIDSAEKYDVLHLSTHATSGDFINPASIAFYDEPMLLNELYSLNIHPNLVVLSACETGVGKLQKGEGAMSIARGFQYAGAKNILFSLWQINDASTSTWMALFYKSYHKTESAFVSNRRAKLEYLNNPSISNIKKSPYYWSAFVYYGRMAPEKAKWPIFYYFIGSLLIAIILFLIYRKRQNHG